VTPAPAKPPTADETQRERALPPSAPTTAELAACTCPEFCERDHDLD
jgi:hypothetical protein